MVSNEFSIIYSSFYALLLWKLIKIDKKNIQVHTNPEVSLWLLNESVERLEITQQIITWQNEWGECVKEILKAGLLLKMPVSVLKC